MDISSQISEIFSRSTENPHRLRRVLKEIIDCRRDKTANIDVELVDSCPFHLKGHFPGPEGTPYENGIFEVDVVCPATYPFVPLQVKFITKVYHPNISPVSGTIYIDILQDNWWPGFTVKKVLISVQSLLSSPEPCDPLDIEASQHFMVDKRSFEETARYWTRIYARSPESVGANDSEVDDAALAGIERTHIDRFEAFGFQRSTVIEVLCKLNYRGPNVANIPDEVVVEELSG
ncbi:ubiquitin-conjugating enzyme/RWD-like protein [Pisolithus microcarpus]|nr:ubiquitin-conjugating enzyme/RWD-like protein [Pisolithus microcarpus]